MSNSGDNAAPSERVVFQRLERAVGEALSRLERTRLRAEAAEARSGELQELLKRFTGDEGAAGRLLTRLKTLEEQNEDLRTRLEKGRESVERLLAQIRFLEGQR